MTNLKCDVSYCAHHQSGCCCLDSINVNGANATNSVETACQSFHKEGSFVSNFIPNGSPTLDTHINCEATNCNFNRGKMCEATNVIINNGGTSDKGHTQCETYTPPKY